MPISRKPPPSLEGDDSFSQEGSSHDVMPNNENVRKFSLTDDPVKPPSAYEELAYDQIDEGVTLMQHRFPDNTSPSRSSLPTNTPDEVPNSIPQPPITGPDSPLSIPQTPYRNSYSSSQRTVYDQDAYYRQRMAEEGQEQQQQLEGDTVDYHEPLPAIDSGLPMQWDLADGHDSSDPFIDHRHPPPPLRMYGEPDPFHGGSAPVSSLPPDEMEPMDSFQYDPERYGSYPQSEYMSQAMSRSPTPGESNEYHAIDEKDTSEFMEQLDGSNNDDGLGYINDPEKMLTPIEPPLNTKHFGPAPTGRIIRRHKTKKRVPLTEGNLVTHIDVPTQLVLPRKGEPEMMQTRCVYRPWTFRTRKPYMIHFNARYTAVTSDPDDFENQRFFLRQNIYGRTTELFICITMYNVSGCVIQTSFCSRLPIIRKTRYFYVELYTVS